MPRLALTLPQLKRSRWGVRGVLALGVAASVTANILHARDNIISQTIAAWPPLALLLTIELIARIPVTTLLGALARRAATFAIAAIAAWVSYWHMAGVTSRYGETGATPYLLPFSVDGLVIVTSVCLVELAAQIRQQVIDARPAEAPKPPPVKAKTIPPPKPASPPAIDQAGPRAIGAGRRLTAVGKLPPKDRQPDVARELAAAGKSCADIHKLWGEPESPKVGTIRWWTADVRKSNGGENVREV